MPAKHHGWSKYPQLLDEDIATLAEWGVDKSADAENLSLEDTGDDRLREVLIRMGVRVVFKK